MTIPRLLRRIALPLALTGLLCSATPASACSGQTVQQILFQAARSGSVSDGYSLTCLHQAQQAETPDLSTYSDADSAIQRAISRAVLNAQLPASQRGSSSHPVRVQQGVSPVRPPSTSETGGGPAVPGPLTRLINAGADSPDSVPLPVFVLGGVALVMAAGGAGSVLVRRRMEPRRRPRD